MKKKTVSKKPAAAKELRAAKKPAKPRRSKPIAVSPVAIQTDAPQKTVDAPHIECRLFVGGIGYPIDPSNLERTIGGGRWASGLIDEWSDAAWVGLLAHLGLPADPLDRTVAAQPVKRLVQRLWYEACAGGVPEESKTRFEERDAIRVAEYKENFTVVKDGSAAKAERARASFGKVRESRGGGSKYEPTEELKKKGPSLGGQQAPLYQFFKAGKFAAATTDEATAGMLAHGLKTGTDPKRISSFYLSRWTRDGLLTRV